jgi:DNA-binding NarL/FixJ family response regulator
MPSVIRVLIVDDHPVVRAGLQKLLDGDPSIEIIGEATTGMEALALADALRPDLILLDLRLPELDGISAIRRIREVSPTSRVLILSGFATEQDVHAAIQAGAVGYLLKDMCSPELGRAIHAAMQGEPALHATAQGHLMRHVTMPPSPLTTLTPRERDVLKLIARGYSNREIAGLLHLTEGTVKGYVSAVLAKLGVADRTQAALYGLKHGLQAEA